MRDPNAEQAYFKKNGVAKRIYRKVLPTEVNRGEAYPSLTAGISLLAHFGLGVGVYYMQLIIQAIVFAIGGLILIPMFISYAADIYGSSSNDPRLYASGSCTVSRTVTATIGCAGTATCSAQFRDHCALSRNAVVADIGMSLVIALLMLLGKFPENELLEQLDEAVQTLQDYSVVVNNPPPDAINPDDWRDFFSRFGTVRLITVAKNNMPLCRLLLRKHDILARMAQRLKDEPSRVRSCMTAMRLRPSEEQMQQELASVELLLTEGLRENYSAVRVYVTFDLEEQQRLCLRELEVPNIELLFVRAGAHSRLRFKEQHVLDVQESQEFSNINWENLGIPDKERRYYLGGALLSTLAILVVSYYFVSWLRTDYLGVLPIGIALVDMAMPVFFEAITLMERSVDEDDRQDSLLVKLFLARFLTTIIFPYVFTSWTEFLDAANVQSIVYTQLAACFIAPLLAATDVYGVFKRNVLSLFLSSTQHEMNLHWEGSQWTLAERYTNLAKIAFLSIFYALITPMSVFIGAFAFTLIFVVDRYLLLRRWKPPKMLDATMAYRIRHITLLAVSAHLYATSRFVYSWPMDDAFLLGPADSTANSTSVFAKVNKDPPYNILLLRVEPWHAEGQASTVVAYKWVAVTVLAMTVYMLIGTRFVEYIRSLFFLHDGTSGAAMGIPFFAVPKIGCYCPVIERGGEVLICADTSQSMEEFLPAVFSTTDLSLLVPDIHRQFVLSVVKWYGLGKTKKAEDLLMQSSAMLPRFNPSPERGGEVARREDDDLDGRLIDSGRAKPGYDDLANLHAFDSIIDVLGKKQFLDVPAASATSTPKTHRKVRKKIATITAELGPLVITTKRGSAHDLLQDLIPGTPTKVAQV